MLKVQQMFSGWWELADSMKNNYHLDRNKNHDTYILFKLHSNFLKSAKYRHLYCLRPVYTGCKRTRKIRCFQFVGISACCSYGTVATCILNSLYIIALLTELHLPNNNVVFFNYNKKTKLYILFCIDQLTGAQDDLLLQELCQVMMTSHLPIL